MLATYRVPLLDARGFVADAAVAQSVVLPGAWADGDFVRGMGSITRRPGGAVEPWAHEAAFADLRRSLTLSPDDVQTFNRNAGDLRIGTVRKRGWLALPASPALFDVDLGVQLHPTGSGGLTYPRGRSIDFEEVAHAVVAAAAIPVRVRDTEARDAVPLLNLGSSLASRYARHTSHLRDGDPLVRSGRTTVVVEAPGLSLEGAGAPSFERLAGTRIHLSSFDRSVPGGGRIRVHVLWDDHGSKGDRKRIRELRIHILRLHSIYELMRSMASLPSSLTLAEKRGDAGFDALQAALLACVRVVRHKPDRALGRSVLETAFSSRNFVDRDLDLMWDRALGQMRPRVRREVQEFLDAERERGIRDELAARTRDQGGPVTVIVTPKYLTKNGDIVSGSKYRIDGDVAGPVGDGARVEGNVVAGRARVVGNVIAGTGHTITIGHDAFPSEQLAAELRALHEHLAVQEDTESEAVVAVLTDAEEKAKAGDAPGVVVALKKAGSWAAGVASQIGVQVAAAAIKASVGM